MTDLAWTVIYLAVVFVGFVALARMATLVLAISFAIIAAGVAAAGSELIIHSPWLAFLPGYLIGV